MENPFPKNPKPAEPTAVFAGAVGPVGPVAPSEKPIDWREKYHSFDELDQAPPISFLIDGFLTENGVTAIAAPVAQRKSLITLNVVRALLTGEKLFDYFEVVKKPSRVLYLCPEMGIQSFAGRLRDIGLLGYVGKTLFCQTMSSEQAQLADLADEELQGAVVILDTAIRFLQGDENSSEDMRKFAASVFRLIKAGAASVLLLHHSAKGTKDSNELTLENSMRGSGELGAFLACCWATRLQDPDEPYSSPSYLKNVKQRDFESKPFNAASDAAGRMTIVGEPGKDVVLQTENPGAKPNRDGKEDAAVGLIRENLSATLAETRALLAEHGIKRGIAWISRKKTEIKRTGVSRSEAA